MKEEIKNLTMEMYDQIHQLRELWISYIKFKGEIELNGEYLTMWDGACERMKKIVSKPEGVFIVDVNDNEYQFIGDTGIDTLFELLDIVFVQLKDENHE